MAKTKDGPETQVQSDTELTTADLRREFGRQLQGLRMGRDLSVEALAHVTRIKPDFIALLESGQIEQLPGQVFGRGFVKNICRALEVEADSLLEAYDRCWEAPTTAPKLHVEVEDKTCSRLPMEQKRKVKLPLSTGGIVGAVAGLVAVALLAVWFGLSNRPDEADDNLAGQDAIEQPAVNEVAVAAPDTQTNAIEASEPPPDAPAVSEVIEAEPKTTAAVTDKESPEDIAGNSPTVAVDAPTPEESPQENLVTVESSQAGDNPQVVTVVVRKKVRAKIRIDRGDNKYVNLEPKTYQYEFKELAQFLIFDAAAVDIIFNGKNIGSLGGPGRVRRIGFAASSDTVRF